MKIYIVHKYKVCVCVSSRCSAPASYCSYFLSLFVISLWDGANVFGAPIEGDLLTTGTPLSSPPLIDLISNDPILCGVKVFQLNSYKSFVKLYLLSV